MDTCVCLAEPLHYTPETTTMLLMAILVRKDKSLKKNEVEEEDTAGGYN